MKKKKKVKKQATLSHKIIGFMLMIVFFYTVNIAGGCQKVLTRANYDFDHNIVSLLK